MSMCVVGLKQSTRTSFMCLRVDWSHGEEKQHFEMHPFECEQILQRLYIYADKADRFKRNQNWWMALLNCLCNLLGCMLVYFCCNFHAENQTGLEWIWHIWIDWRCVDGKYIEEKLPPFLTLGCNEKFFFFFSETENEIDRFYNISFFCVLIFLPLTSVLGGISNCVP